MKKLRIFCLTIIFSLLFSAHSHAQNLRNEMLFYNVGLGSLASGIGALINKKPNEKWHKVILKGMGQGAVGGYVVYQSKNILREISIKEDLSYSWYAKMVNSAGISIIENAAANRNAWELWHINIGFNRIEFHTKEKFSLKYRIQPVSLVHTIVGFASVNFELKKSIQTGEFVFSADSSEYAAGARVYANNVVFTNNRLNNYHLYSHEFTHIYQYYDYNFFNAYLNEPKKRLRNKSNGFNKLSSIFYFDLQGAILRPLYLLENIIQDCYFDNFFEKEAEYFTNKSPICD